MVEEKQEGGVFCPPPGKKIGLKRYMNVQTNIFYIHKFMAWNGYPRHVRRNIIPNLDQNRRIDPTNLNELLTVE